MEAKDIFSALMDKYNRSEYDGEYLQMLVQFRDNFPELAEFEIFYAAYALAHNDYRLAYAQAKNAYRKRKLNDKVLEIFVHCFDKYGKQREKTYYQGLRRKFYQAPLELMLDEDHYAEYLDLLSLAMGVAIYAPFAAARFGYKDGILQQHAAVFGGEYLPRLYQEKYPYWVGVYGEQEEVSGKNWLLEEMKNNSNFALRCGADMVFDIQRAHIVKSDKIFPDDKGILIPIAGTEDKQNICFKNASAEYTAKLPKWMFSYFRIDEPTGIISDNNMVVGKPIPLGHDVRRRKLVLNILVDALSWSRQKELGFVDVPNIMRFFAKGIIFNNHFSVGEYTYPSLATIETGMCPHHSQIFHEQAAVELEHDYITLSEQMNRLGYYCVNIMGVGNGFYNGVTRGYDRLLTNAYVTPAYEGVERTIRHLEAFGDCDQFLFLHTMDVHPWRAKDFQMPVTSQTGLALKDRVFGYDETRPSVYIKNTPLYEKANIDGIRNTDRALGNLFRYLEEHYNDDEYIVQLYSDHGCSVYDESPYLLSEHHVGAAYMIRGAGVPAKGMAEELTSSLDVYPSLGRMVGFTIPEYVDGNLPAALGGKEREYVISNTMYPGQTFKMAIRTKDYECQLVTTDLLTTDGTVNMETASFKVYRRNLRHQQIDKPELNAYFAAIIHEYTKSFDNHGISWYKKK